MIFCGNNDKNRVYLRSVLPWLDQGTCGWAYNSCIASAICVLNILVSRWSSKSCLSNIHSCGFYPGDIFYVDLYHETTVTRFDIGSAPFSFGTQFSFESIRQSLCLSCSRSGLDSRCEPCIFVQNIANWLCFLFCDWKFSNQHTFVFDHSERLVIAQISEVTVYHENVEHIPLSRFHCCCYKVELRGTCLEVQKSIQ